MKMRIFMGITLDTSHEEFILTHLNVRVVHMQVSTNHSIVVALICLLLLCHPPGVECKIPTQRPYGYHPFCLVRFHSLPIFGRACVWWPSLRFVRLIEVLFSLDCWWSLCIEHTQLAFKERAHVMRPK
jgi:hypothetical protein